MSSERVIYQAITPIRQSFDMSCVPASVSMVFSGFGIDIRERVLIDKYFPHAKLPPSVEGAGVDMRTAVSGLVQAIRDIDLQDGLQVDVLVPDLWRYTDSPEERWVVRCEPGTVIRSAKKFHNTSFATDLRTLAELAQKAEIGVYSVNNRMMKRYGAKDTFHRRKNVYIYDERAISKGLSAELVEFVRKGHAIGCHEGLSSHARAIDGSKTQKKGYWIVDPMAKNTGHSYNGFLEASSLFYVHYSEGVQGGMFDYLYRLSEKEEPLDPQQYGFRSMIQSLRNLIP